MARLFVTGRSQFKQFVNDFLLSFYSDFEAFLFYFKLNSGIFCFSSLFNIYSLIIYITMSLFIESVQPSSLNIMRSLNDVNTCKLLKF